PVDATSTCGNTSIFILELHKALRQNELRYFGQNEAIKDLWGACRRRNQRFRSPARNAFTRVWTRYATY
ncbi:MAG TPA: hypothetical protein VK148_21715, partial [Xanthobacteraceae bacterium]|nr:hypothetical protein [Xanthobacteraceae bacterium]